MAPPKLRQGRIYAKPCALRGDEVPLRKKRWGDGRRIAAGTSLPERVVDAWGGLVCG